MKVGDIMTPRVEVIHPDAAIREAAQKMKAMDVGSIPVCDGDRLVGMLTDRDLAVRAVADGKDPASTRARDVMTEAVVYCFEDDTVDHAAEIMERAQIRRLPVLNQGKRLVGVVSLGDLAVRTGDDRRSGESLERVSRSAATERRAA